LSTAGVGCYTLIIEGNGFRSLPEWNISFTVGRRTPGKLSLARGRSMPLEGIEWIGQCAEIGSNQPWRKQDRKPSPSLPHFLFIATVIALIVGESLLFPNPLLDRMWEWNTPAAAAFRSLRRIAGIPLALLGVGTPVSAIGLIRAKAWAWRFAVLLFAANGIGDLVNFVATGDWLRSASGVVISSAFLWTLCARRVRLHFEWSNPQRC
jgi:hypothetical protein